LLPDLAEKNHAIHMRHSPVRQDHIGYGVFQECQSLGAIASDLGYSADHLRRLFAARYGMGPLHYRNERRMAMAADLVANGGLELRAIAERLGFHQVSHFCASYRTHFGTSPGADMRRLRVHG